jgi:hypothetical protein
VDNQKLGGARKMFKVQQTLLLIVVLVQVGLILARRRSADTKPDIVYNQAQNGTYNVRVKVDGVTVRLPTELFQGSSNDYQQPLHDDVPQFNDDNKDEENLDYDVSWFKTQQIKGQPNRKAAHVKKSGVRDNKPPSKLMRFLFRAMSQSINRGADRNN